MNVKAASFVLALALTAIACSMTDILPPQTGLGIPAMAHIASITPTFTASPTHTSTPIPPTNTPTPTKTARPTKTPTASVPMARVIREGSVNLRSGPCNHPILTEATPGMEFQVTGRYTSPGGENWWRIQYFARNGMLVEAWIWGYRVEVTGDALVPFVPSQCPPFLTPTPTHAPSDVYVRLYENRAFGGDFLDVSITDCGLVNLDPNGKFNDSISSFELFAPTNVEVVLAEHHYRDDRFPGKIGRWHGNNGSIQVNTSELRALGLQDEISSVIWLVDGQPPERTYCQR
jgi:hypothetical protein